MYYIVRLTKYIQMIHLCVGMFLVSLSEVLNCNFQNWLAFSQAHPFSSIS